MGWARRGRPIRKGGLQSRIVEVFGRTCDVDRGGGVVRVAITGGTGLIGSALGAELTAAGHEVQNVTRTRRGSGDIRWDPSREEIDRAALSRCEAVIHLAAESIFGRWNEKKKQKIRESRVAGTRFLAETMAGLEGGPRHLISSSAVGVYGDRGDEILTEESSAGDGFLACVCVDWEAACDPLREQEGRVVCVRTGPVLSAEGGMLGILRPLFSLGLGGRVGDGKQWMSWITLRDLVAIYRRALEDTAFPEVVNATAPQPVTNAEFTKILGRVLRRPTVLPAPRFGVRLVLGSEAADEMALASVRAVPKQLQQRGHTFADPTLEPALRHLRG